MSLLLTPAPDELFVDVTYMPDERSVPDERRYFAEPHEDIDGLVDRVVDDVWSRRDEPLDVRDSRGNLLWTNSRW